MSFFSANPNGLEFLMDGIWHPYPSAEYEGLCNGCSMVEFSDHEIVICGGDVFDSDISFDCLAKLVYIYVTFKIPPDLPNNLQHFSSGLT
jgi:hypothetical protein